MKEHPAHVRRRSLWVLIVTVVLFALASLLRVRLGDVHTRVLGVPLETVLTVATYVTAIAVLGALVAWLRTLPRRGKAITVRQLRRQAGYRR